MDELSLQLFILKNFAQFGELVTTQGESLQIIDIGECNANAGPDFINACVIWDGRRWFGNIEVHLKSSDWERHKHAENPLYNNVILHIVVEQDKQIFTKDNRPLPTVEIKPYLQLFPPIEHSLECYSGDIEILRDFFPALLIHRVKRKNEFILELLWNVHGDWENAAFHLLMYNFGFKVNNNQMLQLAASLNYKIIQKNHEDVHDLLALLLGQGGLLKDDEDLLRRYDFLKQKYSLEQDKILWRYSKIHPQNFPEVRIRQVVELIHKKGSLLEWIIDDGTFDEIALTKQTQNHLRINVMVPLRYAYENYYGREGRYILEALKSVEAENNSVIRRWIRRGLQIQNAYESQALLELNFHLTKK